VVRQVLVGFPMQGSDRWESTRNKADRLPLCPLGPPRRASSCFAPDGGLLVSSLRPGSRYAKCHDRRRRMLPATERAPGVGGSDPAAEAALRRAISAASRAENWIEGIRG